MSNRKLTSFTFITLNGFYKSLDSSIDWHRHGEEESEYSAQSLQSNNILLFGRITYQMMGAWWPSEAAVNQLPEVAKGMNEAEKIVFSRTMKKPTWNNSRIIKGNIADEMRKLKHSNGNDMTILGSGSILTQLAQENLIDNYQIMIDPVVIEEGVPVFNNIAKQLNLKLMNCRTFKTGTVLLDYVPEY